VASVNRPVLTWLGRKALNRPSFHMDVCPVGDCTLLAPARLGEQR